MEEALKQIKSNCKKIVLYGPESTGKTTLAIELAKYFDVPWVPEFAREYLQNVWDKEKRDYSLKNIEFLCFNCYYLYVGNLNNRHKKI